MKAFPSPLPRFWPPRQIPQRLPSRSQRALLLLKILHRLPITSGMKPTLLRIVGKNPSRSGLHFLSFFLTFGTGYSQVSPPRTSQARLLQELASQMRLVPGEIWPYTLVAARTPPYCNTELLGKQRSLKNPFSVTPVSPSTLHLANSLDSSSPAQMPAFVFGTPPYV